MRTVTTALMNMGINMTMFTAMRTLMEWVTRTQ